MKLAVLVLSLCVVTAYAQAPSAPRAGHGNSATDPRAMAILTAMTDFLKTQKTFRISFESSRDEVVDTDMKVQKLRSGELSARLPDRLQARVHGDGDRDVEFFYDGTRLTVFSKGQNYYASTPAPPTVARMLDATRARHGIVIPIADFVQMAAGEDFKESILGAGYIGTARIDGHETDHLAIRQADVDWQVWVEKGSTPVPRRLIITTKTEPTQPQYMVTLDWDLSPRLSDALFTFTPPPTAARIPFARVKEGQTTEQP